jgi:hypothetical protein
VAKVGTSKADGTISQLGCGISRACHGRPLKKKKKKKERNSMLYTPIVNYIFTSRTRVLLMVKHKLEIIRIFVNGKNMSNHEARHDSPRSCRDALSKKCQSIHKAR